jgi:hypothetical protein
VSGQRLVLAALLHGLETLVPVGWEDICIIIIIIIIIGGVGLSP